MHIANSARYFVTDGRSSLRSTCKHFKEKKSAVLSFNYLTHWERKRTNGSIILSSQLDLYFFRWGWRSPSPSETTQEVAGEFKSFPFDFRLSFKCDPVSFGAFAPSCTFFSSNLSLTLISYTLAPFLHSSIEMVLNLKTFLTVLLCSLMSTCLCEEFDLLTSKKIVSSSSLSTISSSLSGFLAIA